MNLRFRFGFACAMGAATGCVLEDDDDTVGAETSGSSTAAMVDDGPTGDGGDDGGQSSVPTGDDDGDDDGVTSDSTGGPADSTSTAGPEDSTGEPSDDSTGLPCEPGEVTEVRGCDAIVGEPFCSEGQMHVPEGSKVEWMNNPPHSGPHYPSWEIWGEHETTVPRGNWVHNLEHGGIVLAYRCAGDCEAELDVLKSVVTERPDLRILLTPDPELDGPRFAAISWTYVYETDEPDLATLLCFVDQHEDHAPEDVP